MKTPRESVVKKASGKLAYKNENYNNNERQEEGQLDAIGLWSRVIFCPVVFPCLFCYAVLAVTNEEEQQQNSPEAEDETETTKDATIADRLLHGVCCCIFRSQDGEVAHEKPSSIANNRMAVKMAAARMRDDVPDIVYPKATDIARTDRLQLPRGGYWHGNIFISPGEDRRGSAEEMVDLTARSRVSESGSDHTVEAPEAGDNEVVRLIDGVSVKVDNANSSKLFTRIQDSIFKPSNDSPSLDKVIEDNTSVKSTSQRLRSVSQLNAIANMFRSQWSSKVAPNEEPATITTIPHGDSTSPPEEKVTLFAPQAGDDFSALADVDDFRVTSRRDEVVSGREDAREQCRQSFGATDRLPYMSGANGDKCVPVAASDDTPPAETEEDGLLFQSPTKSAPAYSLEQTQGTTALGNRQSPTATRGLGKTSALTVGPSLSSLASPPVVALSGYSSVKMFSKVPEPGGQPPVVYRNGSDCMDDLSCLSADSDGNIVTEKKSDAWKSDMAMSRKTKLTESAFLPTQ